MRAKSLVLFAAAAVLFISGAASAAEKNGKPLHSNPNPLTSTSADPADPLASNPAKDDWRARAMRAHAEAPTGSVTVPRGTAQAVDERGDRKDGEESGAVRLREDRGEGSE